MTYLFSSVLFIIILTLLFIGIMFFLIKLLLNKNKLSDNGNPLIYDPSFGENLTKRYTKQQKQQLEHLPIKVNKVNIESKELERNKKLLLPRTALPFLSEVVTAFYPVIRDSDKLKVVFTPEMMQQFKKGTAKMMKTKDETGFRAMAVAATGKEKIKEHAKLIQEIDPALVLNASFQLASVVVAQQHMQQINRSLKQIKQQLDGIKNLHMKEYLFHAKGNIDYFEVRVIPHFQANGRIDPVIRNQAEDRFNKTMDMLPNMLSQQQDLSTKIDTIKGSVYFGKAFGEEKEVTDLKKILKEYAEFQEIIELYFKWINEMYVPFLSTCRYSDSEIVAVEKKVKEFEEANISCYKEIYQKIIRWTDLFKVKFFRINFTKTSFSVQSRSDY